MSKSLQIKQAKLKSILLSGLVFLMCVSNVGFAFSQTSTNEYEDAVYAVTLDRSILSAGVFGYEKDGKLYMPVAGLANIYGIFVRYDRGIVTGFIFEAENTYSANANNNEVSYRGQSIVLPSDAFVPPEFSEGDVYLDVSYFNKIWPLDLEVNRPALALKTVADKTLPFAQILERKRRQKELLEKVEEEPEGPLPFLAYPYQLFSKPIFSVNSSAGYNGGTDNFYANVNVGGTQDLLYAQADYNVRLAQNGGEFSKPESLRLRFRRQNIHEGALPFGIEDAQWGDVSLRNRELIGSGAAGRGAIFSTKKNNYSNEFDLITIDGVSNPGWETELYLNNQLIRFGRVEDDGVYRFEDVSVGYGRNNIRVVFYGPQGQISERTETYVYRSNFVKAGENFFSGGVIDQNEYLVPIDKREVPSDAEGLAANIYAARGITNRLTVFGSANLINDTERRKDVDRRYLTAGAMASFDSTIAQAELYKQLDGGAAVDLRTASDFLGFKVNTQTSVYNDFESPDARFGQNAKEFEFDFDIRKSFKTAIGAIGLQAGVDYLEREAGQESLSLRTRQSYGVSGVNFTNTTRSTYSGGKHLNTSGTFSTSTNYKRINIRNSINYLMYPETELSTVDLSMRYRFAEDYDASLSLQRNFLADSSSAGIQLSKEFENFTGGVGVNWSSISGASVALRANTSLGPFGQDGRYIGSSDPLRNVGPIAAFTYNDRDYNGAFSKGDIPVENVRMKIGNNVNKHATNEQGYMFDVSPTAINRVTPISVAQSTIEDPYLIPSNPGYNIYPRPGVVHSLQMPLIETGAIDGTLRWNNGQPIAGLELELMDTEGAIKKKTQTAPDGYFTFEKIVPGSYTIRAAPSSGLNIPFKYVDLTPDNLFQFGMDITAADLENNNLVGLDIGFDDNAMNANSILTLAKGIKGRAPEGFYDEKGKAKSGKFIKAKIERLIQGRRASGINNVGTTIVSDTTSNVTGVRIGRHPGKERVVLDLSQKTTYTLNFDSQNNQVVIEMPDAKWAAKDNWKAVNSSIVSEYAVEPFQQGVKLIMAVADGAKVGKSGLLNADHGKKDRLYIDIIRN